MVRMHLIEARQQCQWSQQEVADRLGTTQNNVSRWERGITTPNPYFRAKICELFGKSAQQLGLLEEKTPSPPTTERETSAVGHSSASPTDKRTLWTVPYARNPHFTGRDDLLEHLAQRLSGEQSYESATARCVALTQQAIKGLGGIGKTQIALEYAYRAREQGRYTHFLWINAASTETLLTSFMELAERLPAFPEKEEKDRHKLIGMIKRWLEACQQRWLLIFDNADDLMVVQEFVPHLGNGSVLLTTRANAVAFLAEPVEVKPMDVREGTQLLLRRAHHLEATDEEWNEATTVVKTLDGFPLALDQAGAYIEETACGVGDYLQRYQDHHQALLARRGAQATHYPYSVATTWLLSLQKVEQVNPAAAELLCVCAFLAPDHIPEKLLKEGAAHWPPVLQQAVADPFTFDQMIEALLMFSLVKRLAGDHLFSMHRLVQAVLQDGMDQHRQETWIKRLIMVLNQAFPAESQPMECWPWCEELVPHVTHVLEGRGHVGDPLETSSLFAKTAAYLHYRARYVEAETYHQRALSLREQVLGTDHQQLVEPLIGLVEATWYLSKYPSALSHAQRVIGILERTQGKSHFALIKPLNILAHINGVQGQFADAERLLLRSLSIWQTTMLHEMAGSEYASDVIPSQDGKEPDAETLIPQVFVLWEQAPHHNHYQIGQTLSILSHVYQQQQRYAEAEAILLPLHRLGKQVLGENHHLIANPLMILVEVYTGQGRLVEAEQCYQRALTIREQALGSRHPQTMETKTSYAAFLRAMGRPGGAERIEHAITMQPVTPLGF